MVRIVTPRGELKEVIQEIRCIKEKTVSFAERTKRVVVKAEKMDSEVTGFMTGSGCFADTMVWGNLTADRVSEILSELLEKGYYNFLNKGYEVIDSHKEIEKLNGRPYFLVETPCLNQFGSRLGGGMHFPQGCLGEDEDCFLDEEDE